MKLETNEGGIDDIAYEIAETAWKDFGATEDARYPRARLETAIRKALAERAPPLPAEVEEMRERLRKQIGLDCEGSCWRSCGDCIDVVLCEAASLLSRWPGVWRPIDSITTQHGMRALTFGRLHDDDVVDMGESPAIQMSTYDRNSGWSSAEWGGHKPTHIYLLPEPPHE